MFEPYQIEVVSEPELCVYGGVMITPFHFFDGYNPLFWKHEGFGRMSPLLL